MQPMNQDIAPPLHEKIKTAVLNFHTSSLHPQHSLPVIVHAAFLQYKSQTSVKFTMEGTESTTRQRATGEAGNQQPDSSVLMSNKPLHRFVQKEPRSIGIVILMFGCAETLMGLQLSGQELFSSSDIYIPFWQGALFLVCGILSIYTELHPSKKMVATCLAMYVVSFLGIIGSLIYRTVCISFYMRRLTPDNVAQTNAIEIILFISSLFVSVLLFFLCVIAGLALKSTQTQGIVHRIPPPQTETTLS